MLTCSVLGMALCLVTLRVLWRWPRDWCWCCWCQGAVPGTFCGVWGLSKCLKHLCGGSPLGATQARVSALRRTAMAQPPVPG